MNKLTLKSLQKLDQENETVHSSAVNNQWIYMNLSILISKPKLNLSR